MNLADWDYLYNWDGEQWSRANLVYTPYVSPDKKTICMSFNRDINYHKWKEENALWTNDMLNDRFARELKFHDIASKAGIPTLKVIDVYFTTRQIFLEWHGDDFFNQAHKLNSFENVLPDWQTQWVDRIESMWAAGIIKFSLHPNSWIAHEGKLIPWNWFFSFEQHEPKVTINSLLVQISLGRQEKLQETLSAFGLDLTTPYDIKQLQAICFNSFRANYPQELIEQILNKHKEKF